MNKTKELLCKIRNAVLGGKLPIEDIPIADIKQSVYWELELNRNTVMQNQYVRIMESFQRLCADVSDEEQDISKIILLLDAMVLCMDMVSDAIHTLANREYWEYKHQEELENPEVQEIIDYIDKNHKISLLNYDFVEEYNCMLVPVYFDATCQMGYVPYKGRRMYFPRSWDEEKIEQYYRSVVAEQDGRSPHCYHQNGCMVAEGDVVVDVGAAEGIFALDVIDVVSKIYLIEADEEWMEALQQTFREDTDKVQIIYGFADCIAEGNRVTLDSLFAESVNYIKMDIEGYEKAALQGADRLLREGKNIKCAICSYHCREDEEWIRAYLQARGFITDVSSGFICPDWTAEAYLEAELRRGIVFGKKETMEQK